MTPEITWVLLRAAGVVALAALTLSVATGLSGPAVTSPAVRGVWVAVHRVAAVIGIGLTLAHVALAVLDPFVAIDLAAAAVPGASAWEPLWVGVGAVAVDLLVLVALTSALRGRGPRTWWTLHVLTYPAWLLATGHAMAIGSDVGRSPYQVAGLAALLLVAAAGLARLWAWATGAPAGQPAAPGRLVEASR
jgi:DMSO/TMAO reductase YedYZ heme-binding membrane subunit